MKSLALSALSCVLPAAAVTISEINGNAYLSPLKGEDVTDVEGLVTAIGESGFFIRSTSPDDDDATSDSIYVYGSSAVSQVTVGDIITLSATVSEYRSSDDYVYLTELTSASDITVVSSGNEVTPVVIGTDRSPPTEAYSSLDNGDVLGLPNNASQLSVDNPTLKPAQYGMDFWESLSGELVSLTGLTIITKPNQYGDVFVRGDWEVTGLNEHGGLTMTADDSNPEAIKIGTPLDGTSNSDSFKVGDTPEDVTGVVQWVYGQYMVLPMTALSVTGGNDTVAEASTLVGDGTCSAFSIGSYNVENLTPDSDHIETIANHIATYLNGPAIMILQEIQDSTGATDDGVVSANETLSTLADLIAAAGGPDYSFTEIPPIDGEDGGEPGGNIRVAYLYDNSIVRLRDENPGSSTEANEVLSGAELKYNPGLIDPSNEAWDASRKPLAAAWETLDGKNKFFTVNVHFASKGGGSSIQGDARPPVNGGVDQRTGQAEVVASFVSSILSEDSTSKILVTGDFNEFSFVQPLKTFVSNSGLTELDEIVGIPATERYTYIYDSNHQQLDHMVVSEAMGAGAQLEHVHVNTWLNYDDAASDHDPTVAVFDVCE
ncbi:endonuclease/exonuclease/phosphatase family protein [Aspergillus stella-maris]|uniref:endonuclease/exonuclease/phosphatase family protein n=1 Tax=Aspergillus stella-maris TaxID=1810926 RepID=UPI003CCDCB56